MRRWRSALIVLGAVLLASCGGDDNGPKAKGFSEQVAGRWWTRDPTGACDNGYYYFTRDGRFHHREVFTSFPSHACDDCQGDVDFWEETDDGFIAVFDAESTSGPPYDLWSWKILDLGSGGKQLELYDEGEGGSLDYTLFSIDQLPASFRSQCCRPGECP